MSATGAPVIIDGPALVTAIVYVTVVPAMSVRLPSVFVIERSAFGFTVVVSVAELLAGLGSLAPAGAATVAVLVIEPVAEPTTVPVTENVTEPPTAMSIDSLSEPVPLAWQVAADSRARPRHAAERRRHGVDQRRADRVGRAGVGDRDRVRHHVAGQRR